LPAHEETAFTDPVAAEYNGFAEPADQQDEAQPGPADPIAEQQQPQAHHATAEQVHEDAVNRIGQHTIEDQIFDEITAIENIDLEKEFINNITASSYFSLDRSFGEHTEPEPAAVNEPSQPVSVADAEPEQQDVSKYHDEKLPYSFLWWLDKTRKEHSGVNQPYVTPEKKPEPVIGRLKPGTHELQQQYYENIFHITSVEELDKSLPHPLFTPTSADPPKRKEQVIIERFIQEEPQIRPQSSDKLDNENKAKKSSEDRDELVSETLAAIYTDQMLYHKAIASYKKLILKFPEKSRYFVEKIEQLEKKTN